MGGPKAHAKLFHNPMLSGWPVPSPQFQASHDQMEHVCWSPMDALKNCQGAATSNVVDSFGSRDERAFAEPFDAALPAKVEEDVRGRDVSRSDVDQEGRT
jgi:hypothetical protein